jgi:arginase
MPASPRPPWSVVGVPIDTVGAAAAGSPPFGTEASPAALRARRLPERLRAVDRGDLPVRVVGTGRDPDTGILGWPSVRDMIATVRADVAAAVADGSGRPLLLGGCCALVMGAVSGARDALGPVAVVSVDGHIDVYDGRTSPTGEAADMPVGALRGLGSAQLLDTMGASGPAPVVAAGDAVVVGARDAEEVDDVGDLPQRLGVRVHHRDDVVADPAGTGSSVAADLGARSVPYWVHLDVDVLDEAVFPATDYLLPGGLDLDQLADVLRPLVEGSGSVGFSLGCYNPSKDPTGTYGDALADLLVDVLGTGG